jgi:hypothetical protein
MPVSNGFARHPWPTRPRTGSTADFGPPGSRLDGPAMLVQEMLKKDAFSKQQHPTPAAPAELIGRIDWHCVRFMLAGVDGLLLQELAKPNQA